MARTRLYFVISNIPQITKHHLVSDRICIIKYVPFNKVWGETYHNTCIHSYLIADHISVATHVYTLDFMRSFTDSFYQIVNIRYSMIYISVGCNGQEHSPTYIDVPWPGLIYGWRFWHSRPAVSIFKGIFNFNSSKARNGCIDHLLLHRDYTIQAPSKH